MVKILAVLLPFLGFGACTVLSYPSMSGFRSAAYLGPAQAGQANFEVTQAGRHLVFFRRSIGSPLCTEEFGPVVPEDLSLNLTRGQRPIPQDDLQPDHYYVNPKACGRALFWFETEMGSHQLLVVRTSTPSEDESLQIRHHPVNAATRKRLGVGIFVLCLALSMILVVRNPD